jgi:hypothetical protein
MDPPKLHDQGAPAQQTIVPSCGNTMRPYDDGHGNMSNSTLQKEANVARIRYATAFTVTALRKQLI